MHGSVRGVRFRAVAAVTGCIGIVIVSDTLLGRGLSINKFLYGKAACTRGLIQMQRFTTKRAVCTKLSFRRVFLGFHLNSLTLAIASGLSGPLPAKSTL